jgi:hypothetical protein
LAQKIFFKDSNEEELDISTLKNSIFGYITQAASLTIRNGVYHRNALYDEFFLNTAALESSVYEKAKLYNYPISLATPASCMVALALDISEIDSAIDDIESKVKSDEAINNVRTLTINKNSKFFFNDIPLMLPNSIVITRTGSGTLLSNNFTYLPQWDVSDFNCSEFSRNTPNITYSVESINGIQYLMMNVELFQMELLEINYDVITQDSLETIFFNTDIENHLAGFEVYVDTDGMTNNTVDNEFFHVKKLFNDSSQGENNTKYVYYTFPSSKSLEIFFNPYPEYRPVYGATVKLRLFTTLGKKGNVSFTGNPTAQIDIMTKDEVHEHLVGMNPVISVRTDLSHGTDRPDIIDIKKGIIRKLLYRDGLVTDRDLNTYFNSISDTKFSNLNRNVISFIKKRDDILKRIYNAYIMMEDADSHVIPTNTINLKLSPTMLEDLKFRLRKGTIIVYDHTFGEYRLLNNDEYPEEFIYEKKSLVYSTPYLIKVNFQPFLRCAHYRTDKSDVIDTKMLYSNVLSPFSYVINKINIFRNSIFEDYYTIYFNMMSNILDQFDQTMLNTTYTDLGAYAGFKVFLLFTQNNIAEDPIACVEMQRVSDDVEEKQWNLTLFTDDIIDDEGSIELKYTDLQNNERNLSLPEKFKIKVLVCYDESAIINNVVFSSRLFTDGFYKKYQAYVPDGYALLAGYTHSYENHVSLHTSLSNICFSDIVVEDDSHFLIKEIPVIGSRYIMDSNTSEKIAQSLKEIEDTLLENAMSLENNTQINLKFYNTFGPAMLYNSDFTNLFIKLKIALRTTFTATIDSRIKQSIVDFVKNSNEQGRLSLSNLTSYLEGTYSSIKYINIIGINDMGLQTIENKYVNDIDSLTKDEFKKYVPEYLNVNMQLDDGILNYSIEIEYV